MSKPTAVTGTLDLARPAPANPDAGTDRRPPRAGRDRHDAALGARVHRPVEPPSSRVTLAPAGGQPAAVEVGADGRFRARARKLERGANRFVLQGSSPGLRPWTVDVSITRR